MRLTVTIFVIFCTGFLISCGKKTEIPNLPIVCDDPAQIQNGSIVTMTLSGKILDWESISMGSWTQVIRIGSWRLPKWLERMLACKKAGEAVTATIPPEEAYGAATEQSIYARVAFGPDQDKVKKGREYEIAPGIKVKVLSIDGDKVTVEEPNSNPLGGKTLVYTVTISDVKNPTY